MEFLSFGPGPLNSIDISAMAVIILSIVFGVIRGFWASLLSTVGWVLAILFTYLFGDEVKSTLGTYIKSEMVALAASYCIVFTITLIIIAIINTILLTILSSIRGGIFDKTFGTIFGMARGVLFVLASFAIVDAISGVISGDKKNKDLYIPEIIKEAKFYPLMRSALVNDLLPSVIVGDLQDTVDMISGTTSDDRFISSVSNRLSSVFTKIELDSIMEVINSKSDSSTSIQDMEKIKIMELLKGYRRKLSANRAPDDVLSSSDFEKLEKIMKGLK